MDLEARLKAASPTERHKAIVEAHEAGWTIRRIAATVRLSVGTVHNIITKGATK